MNIIGIGVDIVDNNRFNKLIKKKKFINRICSAKEINNLKKKKIKFYFYLKDFVLKRLLLKLWAVVLEIIYVLMIFRFSMIKKGNHIFYLIKKSKIF